MCGLHGSKHAVRITAKIAAQVWVWYVADLRSMAHSALLPQHCPCPQFALKIAVFQERRESSYMPRGSEKDLANTLWNKKKPPHRYPWLLLLFLRRFDSFYLNSSEGDAPGLHACCKTSLHAIRSVLPSSVDRG